MPDLVKQAFSADLSKNLYPDNSFIGHSKNDDAYAGTNQVNLPHAGTAPTVELNRTEKGSASKREDSNSKYDLDELTSSPTWITYSEELLTHYNKRSAVLEDHKNALSTSVAGYVASKWAGGENKVGTSGDDRSAELGTGSRKKVTLEDLQAIQEKMNADNVPQENRFALITPKMLSDILNIPEVKSSDFNNGKPLVSGTLGTFLGFNFYVRSSVNRYTTGGNLRDFGSSTKADSDCAGGLFWHKDSVRKAKGGIKTFLNIGDAELYGDKLSALVRFGATKARKDGKGIVELIESAGN